MVRQTLSAIIALIALCPSEAPAVTVSSSAQGGPNAAAMVNILIDAGSDYTVVPGSPNTTIDAAGNPSSSSRAMGSFSNGVTAGGTLLPAANQNANGDAVYAGGIEIDSGICLCTGLITDSDPLVSGVPTGFGVGVEGPNNGQPLASQGVAGELDFELGKPQDADFANVLSGDSEDSDATVLQFQVTLSKPGILRISFVHASDEFPRFSLESFNDTPLVFVGDANGQNLKNFIVFKDSSGVEQTLSLAELKACEFLFENLVAPSPASLPTSPHANVDTTLHFNHEFAGFSKRLTRETCDVYAPGTYTIKIVIQDVGDDNLDSATFFEAGSLKLYAFLPADFNLDGSVDIADFSILQNNYNQCGRKFTDGDANGDGCVNVGDFSILQNNYNQTGGNRNLKFDFDRNNAEDGTDNLIWQQWVGTEGCASRFEGDADGDVDGDDAPPSPTGQLADPCGGGAMALNRGDELASGGEAPESDAADVDQDGDVDDDDAELFGEMIAAEN